MKMLSLTENESAWIEFLRLISGDTDPTPDLGSVQALRLTLGRRKSDAATHSAFDPKFRNQGAPVPSPASADPSSKKWTVTASAARSRRRRPCRDQVRRDGAARD